MKSSTADNRYNEFSNPPDGSGVVVDEWFANTGAIVTGRRTFDIAGGWGAPRRKARKTRFIERAGVLSLSVQHGEFPYKYVTVEGTVVRTDRPPSAGQMLAAASRCLPEEAARVFTVRPDRWLTADLAEEDQR